MSLASLEFQLFDSEVVIDISPRQSTHHQFMFWEHVFKLSEHTPCKSQAHNQTSLEPLPQENLYEGNPITSPTNFVGVSACFYILLSS